MKKNEKLAFYFYGLTLIVFGRNDNQPVEKFFIRKDTTWWDRVDPQVSGDILVGTQCVGADAFLKKEEIIW